MSKNIYLLLESLTPDKRQWKPSMPVLKPVNTVIQVEVPDNYVADVSQGDLLKFDLSSYTVLTPAGLRYIVDELEVHMSDNAESGEEVKGHKTTRLPDVDDEDIELDL